MTEITKIECPDVDNCGSSDAYCFNTVSRMGHCKSCDGAFWEFKGNLWTKQVGSNSKGRIVRALDTEEDDTSNDDMEVVDTSMEQDNNKDGGYLPLRGINAKVMEKYGVVTTGNKQEYVYPSKGIKTRYLDEKGFSTSKGFKGDEFFGQNLFPSNCSKIVTITEGELDALSAYQMLSKGSSYVNPVVSLPSATPSGKFWENVHKWLDSFQTIRLSVDNDKAGKAVALKLAQMYPSKVHVMDHGAFKDANDFLVAGREKDYVASWWGAKKVKPDNILSDASDYLELYDESPDFEYFKTDIPELDEKMLGICKGYITLIQAPSGIGKSEVMRYLEYKLLTGSEYKVASCRKEETKLRSLLGLVSYDRNENLTLKKLVDEKGLEDEVKESIKSLTKDERFVTFSIDETQSNDDTMNQLRYIVAALDVDYLFIEPIQDIVVGSNASEKEGKLSDLITRMGNLCGDTGVGIVIIAHENGDGGAMYSSMITKKAGFKIVLKGDRTSDDPQERNRTYLSIKEKNRVGLGFGDAGALDFDLDSYTLRVVEGSKAPEVPKGNTNDIGF